MVFRAPFDESLYEAYFLSDDLRSGVSLASLVGPDQCDFNQSCLRDFHEEITVLLAQPSHFDQVMRTKGTFSYETQKNPCVDDP